MLSVRKLHRTGAPLSAVQRVLSEKEAGPLETITKALASRLPVEERDWAAALAMHILGCTPDDRDSLAGDPIREPASNHQPLTQVRQ